MSFNITGLDVELFYAVNSAAHLFLFVAFTTPAFILCGLCVVALLLAEGIDRKMKVILINMFIPEIFSCFAGFVIDFGYPLRAFVGSEMDKSCDITLGFSLIFFVGATIFSPFFSIAVYVFLKCDIKKLKWCVIIPFLVISWMITLAVGVLTFLNSNASSVNGFCVYGDLSLSGSSPVFIFLVISTALILSSGLCIMLVFSILSYCYVKKNTISLSEDGSSEIKRAVAKVSLFQALRVSFTMLLYITSTTIVFFQQSIEEHAGIIAALFIEYVVRKLSYAIALLLTPIVFILLLKPVRDTLRQICIAHCFLKKNTSGQ